MSPGSSAACSVRELEARDLPVLKTLLADWAPDSVDFGAHQFRVLVKPAQGGEELLGFAEYQRIMDEGSLLGIAIVPGVQQRGFGMCLLQAVLDEMRAQGCVRCLLEVRRSNLAAQALYRRAEFTLDGARTDYYPPQLAGQPREDALLYSRLL